MKRMNNMPLELSRIFVVFCTMVFALGLEAQAQSYEECKSANPDGIETVLVSNAFIFNQANEDARALGRFEKGTSLFAYGLENGFYAVASRDKGFVGFILMNKLDVPQDPSIRILSPIAKANHKDPSRARNLSMALPGGGQFYAGNQQRGTIILLGSLASFVGGYAVTLDSTERVCQNVELQTGCLNETSPTGLLVGSAMAAGFWIFGILKAKGDANAANNLNLVERANNFRPMIQEGDMGLGLSFSISF